MKLNHKKLAKSYKSNEADKAKMLRKSKNDSEAKTMKNRQKTINITKPTVADKTETIDKSQNERYLKSQNHKTNSFKMRFLKNGLFTNRIVAKKRKDNR